MQPHEQDVRRELVRQWLSKAEQDILAAESLLHRSLDLGQHLKDVEDARRRLDLQLLLQTMIR